jgi:hypothetical protein
MYYDDGGEKNLAGPSHRPQDARDKTSRSQIEASPSNSPGKAKAKAKYMGGADGIRRHSGRVSDEQLAEHAAIAGTTILKQKGKERAHESFSEFEKQDIPGDVRVRGKEQELISAREEHVRNEKRWERDTYAEAELERALDKERIRTLEQEILMLKKEVCTIRESKHVRAYELSSALKTTRGKCNSEHIKSSVSTTPTPTSTSTTTTTATHSGHDARS